MNATETETTKTPLDRLQTLTERCIMEYNSLIQEIRPGEVDPEQLAQVTDKMVNLVNAASASLNLLIVTEARNLATPSRRLPEVVWTYSLPGDSETHCVFDYRDGRVWRIFREKYDVHAERVEFEPTQQYRFYYKSRNDTPAVGQFDGTFEQWQKYNGYRNVIIDAILI